jgi:hypothetical protein
MNQVFNWGWKELPKVVTVEVQTLLFGFSTSVAGTLFRLKTLTLTKSGHRHDFRGLLLTLDPKTAATIRCFLVPGYVKMSALRAVRITHAFILQNLVMGRDRVENSRLYRVWPEPILTAFESFTCTPHFPTTLAESEVKYR